MSLATGCNVELPGKPNPADRPVTPAERRDFTGLFAQNCSGCHGAEGKLGPAPPLNDPIFLAIVPEEELLKVITHGRPGTPMPAFSKELSGTLTKEQIEILAKGLKEHFKQEKQPPPDMPGYVLAAQKPPSEEALKRGEALFASNCATCHSTDEQSDDEATPGRLDNPALLTLFSDQALRRIIITGRPDLGMPNFADESGRGDGFKPLTSQEIDDLVTLLAHWRAGGVSAARGRGVNGNERFILMKSSGRHGF
jgi:mono/diheme cytochrome c family protein